MFSYESPAVGRSFWALGFGLRGLENTAPAMLWPLGRPKTPHLPCFGHSGARRGCSSAWSVPQGRSNGLLEPLRDAPRVLERAARAPARCPRGLEGAARDPAQCPQGAPVSCSILLSVSGCSKWLLKPARCPQLRSERHSKPLPVSVR